MTAETDPLLAVVDRLGRLEGLLVGLQNSITQGQSQTAAFMARVERLEQRQVELERNMVTVSHLTPLTEKVDSLLAAEASRKGVNAAAQFGAGQIVSWAAVVVAALALLSSQLPRLQAPAAPTHSQPGRSR